MELMPVGDSYLWYCDWCDTKNVTPWVRMGEKEISCAACHKTFPSYDQTAPRALGAERSVATAFR